MNFFSDLYTYLPADIVKLLQRECYAGITEVRISLNKPVLVSDGYRTDYLCGIDGKHIFAHSEEVNYIADRLTGGSFYSVKESIKNGFVTVRGGHRIGICGTAVYEGNSGFHIRNVSSFCMRVAREVKGCAEGLANDLFSGGKLCNVLIASPPGCGKTTLLRDIVRCLSEKMYAVGVVDERGEISPLRDGIPQMDVGPCTDVLEGCPKAKGMVLLLRSMSPDVIAVDELGRAEDIDAVHEVLHCGVRLIATAHGYDFADMENRLQVLMRERIFERYLFLSDRNGTGTLEKILDREGNIIRKGMEG